MGHGHGLNGVGNQLTGSQRIFHSGMAHRNAVANADGGDEHRGSAGHGDARFDGRRHFIEVDMSRDDIAVGRNNTDEGATQLLLGEAGRIEQRAVRSPLGAFCGLLAAKWHLNPP
ncbi:hypothetical protein SDC9_99806 [bioreactor metagenome]|uniref:Uncharacterized protein n=1 Tax=bioreactor metagenome TaxID=1076179 RepID=A0A645AII8_9ZZZZ